MSVSSWCLAHKVDRVVLWDGNALLCQTAAVTPWPSTGPLLRRLRVLLMPSTCIWRLASWRGIKRQA